MTDPLASFTSLVPTPAPPRSRIPSPQPPKNEDVSSQDRFASLFSPPTPPASPRTRTPIQTHTSIFGPPAIEPNQQRPRAHGRALSEADWGAFISVPTSQDPLAVSEDDFSSPIAAPSGPTQPDPSFEFFESFGETARQASNAKRKSVLDELLAHEDDPLYFLANSSSTSTQPPESAPDVVPDFSLLDIGEPLSRTSSPPSVPQSSSQSALLDQRIDLLVGDGDDSTFTPRHPGSTISTDAPPAVDRSLDAAFGTPAFTPSGMHATDLLAEALSSSHDTTPSIPTDEANYTHPEPTRTASFAARWMPSLRPGRSSPSQTNSIPSGSASTSGSGSASASSSLTATLSRTVSAALVGAPAPRSRENPFAVHIFQPASGAPGYAGENPRGGSSAKGPSFEFRSEDAEETRAVVLEGRKTSTTPVLTPDLATKIRPSLPVLHRLAKSWELLYSLDQHGISLRTLYARCSEPSRRSGARPALLVVRDAYGGSFGAFVGEGIHSSPGAYYGGGESFLWKLDPSEEGVVVFRWTGKNDYVTLCETDSISFGGGDGHYGLFLDDVLQDGSSAQCPTFDNKPLCTCPPGNEGAKSIPFECVGVEVWAIGT